MSEPKRLTGLYAGAGNRSFYRTSSGDVPQVDAVEVHAIPAWLKSDRFVTAELSPKEARQLAIQLLKAAEEIATRLAGDPS